MCKKLDVLYVIVPNYYLEYLGRYLRRMMLSLSIHGTYTVHIFFFYLKKQWQPFLFWCPRETFLRRWEKEGRKEEKLFWQTNVKVKRRRRKFQNLRQKNFKCLLLLLPFMFSSAIQDACSDQMYPWVRSLHKTYSSWSIVVHAITTVQLL